MPITNSYISAIFEKLADLLEIKGENPFRIRAYRNASRTVMGLSVNAYDMMERGEDFTGLPGIGEDLAKKIEEIIKTGKLTALEKAEKSLPRGLGKMMSIQGLGPRRIKTLYDKLGIDSIESLAKAAESKKIRNLPGFGEKTEANILREIDRVKRSEGNIRISDAEEIAVGLTGYLRKIKGVKKVIVAGSYRRAKETVRDIDILVTCDDGSAVMARFTGSNDVEKIVSNGTMRSTVILRSGIQVDLRVVPEESYGAALLYFTGSKAHNIAIRKLAIQKSLKINEYGVYRKKKKSSASGDEIRVAGRTEEEVYKEVGLSYIEPELREDTGEIEAARTGKLPDLIKFSDIKGDLHAHTDMTDGNNTIIEMAETARLKGYEYLGITDHSKHVTIAHGLNGKELLRQIKEIDRINEKIKGITILKGMEIDILEDGSLDLEDEVAKELDFTVCAVHSKFNLPMRKQTERIIRAMDNMCFNIFAHPTARLINERDPYEIDMEKIMVEAKKRGCVLEVNSHPYRMDLNDIHCRLAKEIGVKIAISTDSHSTGDLDYMRFGIMQARRGWLEKKDVVNTASLSEFKKLLKRI